ncbi:hypothetical protein B8V81_2713 [Paenibacillus pasadenensis]|uniref:Uncharacterized protein n=1 Tax=Paenibacillus pasadenensis TaxID=217090 RepID=A0A2N5N1S1_9BACL|nr:hypothetical protein B8V81_2713 [Paenibacillus pasadenensis]
MDNRLPVLYPIRRSAGMRLRAQRVSSRTSGRTDAFRQDGDPEEIRLPWFGYA